MYWGGLGHTANAKNRTFSPPPSTPEPNAGSYLRDHFGEGYFSVGLTFDHGAAPDRVPALPATFADAALANAGLDTYLLDLHAPVEARVRDPLMPLELWRLPDFTVTVAIAFCVYAAWLAMTFFVALTLQDVLGYEPIGAAVALLPLAAGAYIGSTAAGRLLPRCGPRMLLVCGTALLTAGLALTATIDADSGYWPRVVVAVIATSLGLSITFVTCNVLALAHAPAEDESLVGGLFATVAQGVAGGAGVAVTAAVAALRIEPGAVGAGLAPSYQAAFWTATGLAATALLLAAGPLGPRRRSR